MASFDPTLLLSRDVTCLGCGCLCDDIELSSDAPLEVAFHGCRKGRDWFETEMLASAARQDHAPALIDGRPVSLAEGIAGACARIKASRSPLIRPSCLPIEATSALIGLADQVGALVEPSSSHPARIAAIQRVGEISATLGEVRDRAQFALIWGVNLDQDYPRFRERFLSDHFLPGREVLEFGPDGLTDSQAELFAMLRALVAGRVVESGRLGAPGINVFDLAARLAHSEHGVVVYGPDLERNDPHALSELFHLVRDLNAIVRFVAIGLGDGTNAGGIASVLTWTAGAPCSVDFSLRIPRYLPDESLDKLARGEVDLVIQVSGAEDRNVAGKHIRSHEHNIVIRPGATDARWRQMPGIRIEAQSLGIEESGTVSRMDGVLLPTSRVLASRFPSVLEVIQNLNASLCDEEIV